MNESRSEMSLSAIQNEMQIYMENNQAIQNDEFSHQFKREDQWYVK